MPYAMMAVVRVLWLAAIGLSAAFLAALWLLLSVERMGARITFGLILIALIYRGLSSKNDSDLA